MAPSLKPPPKLKVSEWADQHRQLSRETCAKPGQWDTNEVPHMREPMDCVNDPDVVEMWMMKSSQIGYTSSLENIIGYICDQDPSPAQLIAPTVGDAEKFSKTRLAPMIRDTPRLRSKMSDVRSRDSNNTMLMKKYPGGHLILAGANAPSGLASNPIRYALFDEIDRYPLSAGTEGDPLSLGIKRTVAFWNRKIIGGSTPGIKGVSLIEAKYLGSDQRRWFVPCPHCGEYQTLKWAQVKFDPADPDTARYGCEHCGVLWSDVERWGALMHGQWRASKPFKGIAGFHMNEIASTFVRLPDMVRAFLEAKKSPEKLKTFTNTSLAETWEEAGTTIEHSMLVDRAETYSAESIPEGVLMLTVGGDTQDDRVELQLLGWGADEECWILEHAVIRGDPDSLAFWKGDVDPYLKKRYRTIDGRELAVEAVAIDSGGLHTQRVYDYVKSLKRRRVWAIKGAAGPRLAWPKKASRGKSRGSVFVIGVDTIKGILYGRLRLVLEEGPSFIHLPASADEEFCRQLTSEKSKTKFVKGRPTLVWEPRAEGIRQEAQDCWLYGYAAMLGRGGLKHLDRLSAGRARAPKAQSTDLQTSANSPADTPEEPSTPPAPPEPPQAPPPAATPQSTGARFQRKGWFRR